MGFSKDSASNNNHFMDVIFSSAQVRTHCDLFLWLQGDLQIFLPHDILLTVWKDEHQEDLQVDVISSWPGIRTGSFVRNDDSLLFLQDLFHVWNQNNDNLFCISMPEGFAVAPAAPCPVSKALKNMHSALAHGIRDQRGHSHCLYVVFSRQLEPSRLAKEYLRILTPHIDSALRQIPPLPPAMSSAFPEGDRHSLSFIYGLTDREQEVMAWVRAGKTNEVIGQILSISPYTVKNHLQRIYGKLCVSNRAHAVSKLDQVFPQIQLSPGNHGRLQ